MMTAESVQNSSIKKSFFGYRISAVDELLDEIVLLLKENEAYKTETENRLSELSRQCDEQTEAIAQLKASLEKAGLDAEEKQSQIDELNSSVQAYELEHDELVNAVTDFCKAGRSIVEEAELRAAEIIARAEREAQELHEKSRREADEMILEAESRCEELNGEYEKLRGELSDFCRDVADTCSRHSAPAQIAAEEEAVMENIIVA